MISQYGYVKELLRLKDDIYKDILAKINNNKIAHDDREVVEIIYRHFVHQPSTLSYNLSLPDVENPSPGQTQYIDEYLRQMV